MSLGNNERRMLRAMLSDASRTWNLTDLLEATGWSDQVHIAGAGTGLAEAGLLEISESIASTVSLGSEGEKAAKAGLLESRIWDWMQDDPSGG